MALVPIRIYRQFTCKIIISLFVQAKILSCLFTIISQENSEVSVLSSAV